MKYLISAGHRKFYEENGTIEFEEFLNEKALHEWNEEVSLQKEPLLDRWRYSNKLKKLETQRRFVEVARQLTDERLFVLACDYLFDAPLHLQEATLDQLFPFQGLICGFIICLSGEAPLENPASFLPLQAGSALFVGAKKPLDFSSLAEGNRRYLLIALGQATTLFTKKETPYESIFLRQGYGSGDRLADKGHPLLT